MKNKTFKKMETVIISVGGIIYGITMKIADALDEHGLRFFKNKNLHRFCQIGFGVAWGGAGVALMSADTALANALLAMILAFVLRGLIDYTNHAIAVVGMILFFITTNIPFDKDFSFIFFFLTSLVLGNVKDLKYKKSMPNSIRFLVKKVIPVTPVIYGVPGILYAIYSSDGFLTFVGLSCFEIAYILTSKIGKWNSVV